MKKIKYAFFIITIALLSLIGFKAKAWGIPTVYLYYGTSDNAPEAEVFTNWNDLYNRAGRYYNEASVAIFNIVLMDEDVTPFSNIDKRCSNIDSNTPSEMSMFSFVNAFNITTRKQTININFTTIGSNNYDYRTEMTKNPVISFDGATDLDGYVFFNLECNIFCTNIDFKSTDNKVRFIKNGYEVHDNIDNDSTAFNTIIKNSNGMIDYTDDYYYVRNTYTLKEDVKELYEITKGNSFTVPKTTKTNHDIRMMIYDDNAYIPGDKLNNNIDNLLITRSILDDTVLPDVIYVDSINGSDSNSGESVAKAIKNIDHIFDMGYYNADLTIYLVGDGEFISNIEKTKKISSFNSIKLYGLDGVKNISLGKEENNSKHLILCNDLTIDNVCFNYDFSGNKGEFNLIANGYNLVICDNVSTNIDSYNLNSEYPSFNIYAGGYYEDSINTKSNIVINNGTYGNIVLANYEANTGSSDKYYSYQLDITGNTTVNNIISANNYICYTNTLVNVNKNASINYYIGGAIGSNTYNSEAIKYGTSQINVVNGSINYIIGGGLAITSANISQYSKSTINVSNGTIGTIIGGTVGGNTYNDIYVNISGGVINNGIYGGGAGMLDITSYTDILPTIQNVNGNLELGNTYATIYFNVTGGTINTNIYAGGLGYDFYKEYNNADLFNNAQVTKGIHVNVGGCVVNGNVYGYGKKILGLHPGYHLIALVYPFIDLNIGNIISPTKLNGSIYTGSVLNDNTTNNVKNKARETNPTISLIIINSEINSDGTSIYIGEEDKLTTGDIELQIDDSIISNDILFSDNDGSIDITINKSTINGLSVGNNENKNSNVSVVLNNVSSKNDINISSNTNNGTDVEISNSNVNNINITGDNNVNTTIKDNTVIEGNINDLTNSNIIVDTTTKVEGEISGVTIAQVKDINLASNTFLSYTFDVSYLAGSDNSYTYKWYRRSDETLIYEGKDSKLTLSDNNPDSYYCMIYDNEELIAITNDASYNNKSEVKGASVRFDDGFTVTFYVNLSDELINSNKEATITINDRTINYKLNEIALTNKINAYKAYEFSIQIYASEYNSDIIFEIKDLDIKATYSLEKYCHNILNSTDDIKLKSLIESVINYCSLVCEIDDVTLDNIIIDEKYNKEEIISNNDIIQISKNVNLNNATYLSICLVFNDNVDITKYKAYVDDSLVDLINIDGKYYITINNIDVLRYNKAYVIKLISDNNEITIKYSVLSYLYNLSLLSSSKIPLALYAYYLKTLAYLSN